MAKIPVRFVYLTSIAQPIFRNARLLTSWEPGVARQMEMSIGEDGCPRFAETVEIDEAHLDEELEWEVLLDAPWRTNMRGIATEVPEPGSTRRTRSFKLRRPEGGEPQEERYYLTHCRRLGAQKWYPPEPPGVSIREVAPRLQFSVWAPNARNVEVVFGRFGFAESEQSGYIADDGFGSEGRPIPMTRGSDGVWRTDPDESDLRDFHLFDHKLYMFRITKDDGKVAYRTDLYSRCQVGKGSEDPHGRHYEGHYTKLDGSVSCSVVIDPDTVTKRFREPAWPETEFVPAEQFWADEFDRSRPLPQRVEDLVLYELHVGSLAYGTGRPGDFGDTIAFLDHLVDLGVNAIELLPISQFAGAVSWGYGTSHFLAMEFTAGGRDQLKYLVKACHQRGIAVILDVVYNHYKQVDADRAEDLVDSNARDRDIYYWYEGKPSDYCRPDGFCNIMGGYLDNGSTGRVPNYQEEMVRKLFISSAVSLVAEFHVDGLRVDLTSSIHNNNRRLADGLLIERANQCGQKLLRELTRTVRMVNPKTMLMAEDHSGWYKVTEHTHEDGLGFDAVWYAQYYHHLMGDSDFCGPADARLLKMAGYGDDRPLAMGYFAGALRHTGHKTVVYHESHDEAGNAAGTQRSMVTAVNGAPLVGETRRFAEARSRFAFGVTMLSPGSPMFLMGEEVAATTRFLHNDVMAGQVDFARERRHDGARMFAFYRDMIKLRLGNPALRSREIEILLADDERRLLAFLRWHGSDAMLAVATLSNRPIRDYTLSHSRLGSADWKEIINSDAKIYGGDGVGNYGSTLRAEGGRLRLTIPANGVLVFARTSPPP